MPAHTLSHTHTSTVITHFFLFFLIFSVICYLCYAELESYLEGVFKSFDEDGSGDMEEDEFAGLLHTLGTLRYVDGLEIRRHRIPLGRYRNIVTNTYPSCNQSNKPPLLLMYYCIGIVL